MIGRRKCCCGPPPPQCLSICWLCAGAPGSGFSEVLSLNKKTGRYEGTQSRGTVQGSTVLVQRKCNGVWSPDPGFPVPINQSQLNPPFAQVPDNCCACGIALVCVTDSCTPPSPCGLGCEAGIFGSPYNQLPTDWDVPIGASLTNLGWNSCPAMADTYTVSGGACSWSYVHGIGIIMPGQRCGYEQPCGSFATLSCGSVTVVACPSDPDHQCCVMDYGAVCECRGECFPVGYQGSGTGKGICGINLQLNFVTGQCGGHFVLTIDFGCTGLTSGDNSSARTDCRGHATYTSDNFPAVSPVPTSVTLHGGGSAGPACNGSMPGSITITGA